MPKAPIVRESLSVIAHDLDPVLPLVTVDSEAVERPTIEASAPEPPAPEIEPEPEPVVVQPVVEPEPEPVVVQSVAEPESEPEPLPDPNARFEYDEVDQVPTTVSTQAPVYTPEALNTAREGSVRLRLLVGTDGRINSVRVIDGISDPEVHRAAMGAVLRWRFTGGSHRGVPVRVWVPVRLDFQRTGDEMRAVVTFSAD